MICGFLGFKLSLRFLKDDLKFQRVYLQPLFKTKLNIDLVYSCELYLYGIYSLIVI